MVYISPAKVRAFKAARAAGKTQEEAYAIAVKTPIGAPSATVAQQTAFLHKAYIAGSISSFDAAKHLQAGERAARQPVHSVAWHQKQMQIAKVAARRPKPKPPAPPVSKFPPKPPVVSPAKVKAFEKAIAEGKSPKEAYAAAFKTPVEATTLEKQTAFIQKAVIAGSLPAVKAARHLREAEKAANETIHSAAYHIEQMQIGKAATSKGGSLPVEMTPVEAGSHATLRKAGAGIAEAAAVANLAAEGQEGIYRGHSQTWMVTKEGVRKVTAEDIAGQVGRPSLTPKAAGEIARRYREAQLGFTRVLPVKEVGGKLVHDVEKIEADPELRKVFAREDKRAIESLAAQYRARRVREQREAEVKAGAIEVTVKGEAMLISASDANRIKKESPELYKILKDRSYGAYVAAINARRFEAQQFKKHNTELPDGQWISNRELARIKKENPSTYKLLTTRGFAVMAAIVETNRAAVAKLKPYTEPDGGVDGAKYLREHPGDRRTLRDAGFNPTQIGKWQEYNKTSWAHTTLVEKYFATMRKAGGAFVLEPPTISQIRKTGRYDPTYLYREYDVRVDKFWKEHPRLLAMRETAFAPREPVGKAPLSLSAFTAEFLFARGIEPVPIKSPDYPKYREARQAASAEYVRLYGTGATGASLATSAATLLFSPARALHPEVTVKDIAGWEWAIGGAQLVLIGAPFLAMPFGAAARGVALGAQGVAMGVFGAHTATQWGEMDTTQKVIAISIDVLITGAILRGAGIRIPRGASAARQASANFKQALRGSGASVATMSKVDRALADIIRGIETKNKALIRRGAEALRDATKSPDVPASIRKVIADGGSYIEANAGSYKKLIDATRNLTAAEKMQIIAKGKRQIDVVSQKAMDKTITLLQRESREALRQRLRDSITRAQERLDYKPLKPKHLTESERALKEVDFILSKAGKAETYGMLISRLEAAQRRLASIAKARRVPSEADALFGAINKWLKRTRADYIKPRTMREIKDSIAAIERQIVRLRARNEIGVGRYVSDINKYLDEISQFLAKVKREGLTVRQMARQQYYNDARRRVESQLARIRSSRASQAVRAKEMEAVITDIEKYLAHIKAGGLTRAQMKALAGLEARLKHLKSQRWSLNKVLDDIEKMLVDVRKAKAPTEVEQAIAEAESIIRKGRPDVPKTDVDQALDDIDRMLRDARTPKPTQDTGKGGVATATKTKVEVKPEIKVKPEVKVKPKVKPTPSVSVFPGIKEATAGEAIRQAIRREARPVTIAIAGVKLAQLEAAARAGKAISPYAMPKEYAMAYGQPAPSPLPRPSELAVAKPTPEVAPLPTPVPEPEPTPAPSPIPEPKPTPVPKPKPEPKPELVPKPKPKPKPEPVVKPKLKPKPIKRPRPPMSDKEKRKLISEGTGAFAFRMGELGKERDVWYSYISPYNKPEHRIVVVGKAPKGAMIVRGPGSAIKTAQMLYGKALKEKRTDDIGFMDAIFEPMLRRKGIRLSFSSDPKGETIGHFGAPFRLKKTEPISPRVGSITDRRARLSNSKGIRITPKAPRLR